MKPRYEYFSSDSEYKDYLRRYYAGLAMQGLLASPSTVADNIITAVSFDAVRMADALIAELEKK